MLDVGEAREDQIVLQDSLEAFRDFRAMLFTPLESCLNPSHTSASDLKRLLDLLLLCHKYLATKLEDHIVSLITPLTRVDVLASNITDGLTVFKVVEIAKIVNQPEIAANGRALILAELWSGAAKSPYDALIFGENINDKEVIGAAYYQTLLYRWPMWSLEKRLGDQHRRHIKYGMNRCGEEWQKIFNSWGSLAAQGEALKHENHTGCALQTFWLQSIWVEAAKDKLQWFDVVGKLCAAIRFAAQYDCFADGRKAMEAELTRVKTNLYALFVPEEAIALRLSELQASLR